MDGVHTLPADEQHVLGIHRASFRGSSALHRFSRQAGVVVRYSTVHWNGMEWNAMPDQVTRMDQGWWIPGKERIEQAKKGAIPSRRALPLFFFCFSELCKCHICTQKVIKKRGLGWARLPLHGPPLSLSFLSSFCRCAASPTSPAQHISSMLLLLLPATTHQESIIFFQDTQKKHKIHKRERARSCLVRKNFQDFPLHRIFGRMHGALNIDKNKN